MVGIWPQMVLGTSTFVLKIVDIMGLSSSGAEDDEGGDGEDHQSLGFRKVANVVPQHYRSFSAEGREAEKHREGHSLVVVSQAEDVVEESRHRSI